MAQVIATTYDRACQTLNGLAERETKFDLFGYSILAVAIVSILALCVR